MRSISRSRVLSIFRTTEVSQIWWLNWVNSCRAYDSKISSYILVGIYKRLHVQTVACKKTVTFGCAIPDATHPSFWGLGPNTEQIRDCFVLCTEWLCQSWQRSLRVKVGEMGHKPSTLGIEGREGRVWEDEWVNRTVGCTMLEISESSNSSWRGRGMGRYWENGMNGQDGGMYHGGNYWQEELSEGITCIVLPYRPIWIMFHLKPGTANAFWVPVLTQNGSRTSGTW